MLRFTLRSFIFFRQMSTAPTVSPHQVLDFWLLPAGSEGYGNFRREWFQKNDDFDDLIRQQFGEAVDQAIRGELREAWSATPASSLAHIILLDQFPRNLFRNSPKAFSGDALALECAKEVIAKGFHTDLLPIQKMFIYLPFEHSEVLAEQERSLELFTEVAADPSGKYNNLLDYARGHHAAIVKYGRFPHRNAVLGRESTDEEKEYLAAGGGY